MEKFVRRLSSDKLTQDIPVTILKNSNYRESFAVSATDFILKEGLSPEVLKKAIFRAVRLKAMQRAFISSLRKLK